jgi:hypothetical protein
MNPLMPMTEEQWRRTLWAVLQSVGGRVMIDRGMLESFDPETSRIETWTDPVSGYYGLRATVEHG